MKNITNIRYENGKIAFDYCGTTIFLRETDVCIVGQPIEIAQKWIWQQYGFILQFLAT